MALDLTSPAGRRRFIIDMVKRRVQPGSGSSVEFLRRRTWSDPAMALDLATLKTPFVIVGGVATALYMPLRVTVDLDILVVSRDAGQLEAELAASGCKRIGVLGFGGSTWRVPDGPDLDVLESVEAWAEEAIGLPNRSPTGLPVIGLPYLVLMKLDASRSQDVADVNRMLGGADEAARNGVRDVIRRFRPEQLEDVESLIVLGELEYR